MPQPTRMAPWCIEGHRKGCSWAEEGEKPGLLHNLTANKPALVLFYVPESIEGVALKEVMTNVSLFVNTKHFHRKDSDGKPTVPFVRFYTVNVGETTKNKPLEGHNKDVDAIRKAYG